MAEIRHFPELARLLQSSVRPAGGPTGTNTRRLKMTALDIRTRLFGAVFALGVSAIFFATAIVPASPNGIIIA
tara:strand:- start:137 stop:355 length:219 start_codon:yes stop_codon:yes gene_type:complete